jgi:hypothetical protein
VGSFTLGASLPVRKHTSPVCKSWGKRLSRMSQKTLARVTLEMA